MIGLVDDVDGRAGAPRGLREARGFAGVGGVGDGERRAGEIVRRPGAQEQRDLRIAAGGLDELLGRLGGEDSDLGAAGGEELGLPGRRLRAAGKDDPPAVQLEEDRQIGERADGVEREPARAAPPRVSALLTLLRHQSPSP